jgi:hypothetical protein
MNDIYTGLIPLKLKNYLRSHLFSELNLKQSITNDSLLLNHRIKNATLTKSVHYSSSLLLRPRPNIADKTQPVAPEKKKMSNFLVLLNTAN